MLVTILDTRVTTSVIPLLILFILSFSMVTIIVSSIIPSVSAISNGSNYNNYLEQVQANYNQEKSSNWKLGNNLAEGDYFVYKICNGSNYNTMMYQIIHPYHCYQVTLEFVTILESYSGKVWIVQGNLTTPEINQQMIFLIDVDTFEITTDKLNVNLGNSIQNTIFSLSVYGVQSLSIGTIWDEMDSYFTNKIPLEIKNKQTIQIPRMSINGTVVTNIETSVLSYDIIVQSNVYLHNDFPFPIKAKLYSPNIIYPEPVELYYYELLEYQSVLIEDEK